MKRPRVDELEAIIRRRVCSVCDVKELELGCGRCSLTDLFPLVAQAVLATDSDNIEDYRAAIRENVCSACVDQHLDGTCDERGTGKCALDAYMAPIVEAIREATGRSLQPQSL